MILFFDNDKPQAPVTGRRKYIRRLVKMLIILTVLLCISLWVLKSLGGNSKPLKLGMQDYLTDVTGYIAQVDSLVDMRFFPMSHISLSGLSLHKMIEKEQIPADQAKTPTENSQVFPYQKTASDFFDAGPQVAHLESLVVTLSFWDVFFSRRRFYEFDLRGLVFDEGLWGLQALNLEKLVLDGTDPPAFIGQGFYGGKPFSLRVNVQKETNGAGRARYRIPDYTPVVLSWGELSLQAVLGSAMGKGIDLQIKELRIGQQNFSGDITWRGGFKGTTLSARLKTGGADFVLEMLTGHDGITTGTLEFPVLDIDYLSSLQNSYATVADLFRLERKGLVFSSNHPMTLDVKFTNIQRQDKSLGHMTAQIKTEPRKLEIVQVTGLLGGGALTGDMKFEWRDQQLNMTADGKLRGWDYALHEDKPVAQLDIHASLQAQASSWAELVTALAGEMIVVAEPADLVAMDMLYQTGSMLSLLQGSQEPVDPWPLSCGFFDVSITNGQATLQRAYLDGENRVIEGRGDWDWQTGKVDIQMIPYAKEGAHTQKLYPVTVKGTYPSWNIKTSGGAQSRTVKDMKQQDADFSRIKPENLALSPRHPCQVYLGAAQP